ncbi:MAG: methenyltetrahydromethanopterin cyclohydrolase [Halolamina sp.]
MDSLNRMAVELVDEALDFADELNIVPRELPSGATVIDFGVDAVGGIEAGLLLSEIQTAGLATVQTRMDEVAGAPLPHVELSTDHPAISLLCSQKAGWELAFDGDDGDGGGSDGEATEPFEGLGAGPARALVGDEAEFQTVGYYDEFDLTVLSVESDRLPDGRVASHVADTAGVEESAVFLPSFRTASAVGSVTTAARATELALFQLFELGFDPTNVLTATGTAPVAPVAGDEATALARTNDALAYGGEVYLRVARDFEGFDRAVSAASDVHGDSFAEVFAAADWEFDEVPTAAFAPAKLTVDVVGGDTHVIGETDTALLAESFDL